LKWDMDIFINHSYLSRFTGNETFEELNKVTFADLFPQVRFDFTSKSSCCDIIKGSHESVRIHDIDFKTKMDTKQWINTFMSSLLKNYKKVLTGMFIFPMKFLKILITAILIKAPLILIKNTAGLVSRIKERHNANKYSKYTSNYYNRYGRDNYKTGPGILTRLKNLIFSILYVICFPLRLIFKFKTAIFCIIAVLYCFLAFTGYGKYIAAKQFNVDLIQFQNGAINSARQLSSDLMHKFQDFTGISSWQKNGNIQQSDASQIEIPDKMLYQVTAVNGLNIRKLPDVDSEKITGNSLAFGSVVTYLSKSKSDSSGRLWYYILSPDGRAGWVSAKFLKEKKKG
jgi:hypothetical protein